MNDPARELVALSPDPAFATLGSPEVNANESEVAVGHADEQPTESALDAATNGQAHAQVITPSKRRFFDSISPPMVSRSPSKALAEAQSIEGGKTPCTRQTPTRSRDGSRTPSKKRRFLSPLPSNGVQSDEKANPDSTSNGGQVEAIAMTLDPAQSVAPSSPAEHKNHPAASSEQNLYSPVPLFLDDLDEQAGLQISSTDAPEKTRVKSPDQAGPSSSNYIDLTSSPEATPSPESPVPVRKSQKDTVPIRQSASQPERATLPEWEKKYLGAFMCEGYMIYSSARLTEGEPVWLSRDVPDTNSKKNRKVVSSKKEDHVVRTESKRNGSFARLNEKFAKWIVKLLDQKLFHFEGTLMFPPARPSTGDTVHIYLKAYILRSAFISPTDKVFDQLTTKHPNTSSNYFNRLDDKEDKDRIEKQQSINKLFGIIGLVPTISSTAGKKQQVKTGAAPPSSSLKTAGSSSQARENVMSIKGDPGEEGEIAQENLDLVYQKAATHDMSMDLQSPCEGFKLSLRPYQQQGLGWMMKMEGNTEAREEVSIHPLWEEYAFPEEEGQVNWFKDLNAKFYYNPYMGELSFEFPRASRKCRGGILADEMGLGKTIQMAALICTARPAGKPLLDTSAETPLNSNPCQAAIKGEVDLAQDEEDEYLPDAESDDGICELPSMKKTALNSKQTKLGQMSESATSQRKSHATLVICPLTLLDQWKDELERCHKGLRVFVYHTDSKGGCDLLAKGVDVVITTYGLIASEWAAMESKSENKPLKTSGLFNVEWYRIILDEGHNIKNRSARTSTACYNLKGKRRWVLSGTPIVNKLEDLASLLHFIQLEPWGNFSFYRSFVTVPFSKKDPKALVVVQTIIESVLLRREKKMKDLEGNPIVSLPPKHVAIKHLDLNPKEQMIYDLVYRNAKSDFLEYLGQGTVLRNVTAILAILMRLRQAVLHPMLVLEKIKVNKQKGNEEAEKDANIIGQMLKEYRSSGEESFAATQMRELEKKLRGEGDSGEAEEEECILCLDVMDSRLYLPCMHAFCKNCIMAYIESKAGEQTICPSCEAPFQERDIVEFVVNHSKKSVQSSGANTPLSRASQLNDDEIPDIGEQPLVKSQLEHYCFSDPPKLDHDLVIDNIPKGKADHDGDVHMGGYLKRNDFVSSTKLEALISHLTQARNEDPGFSAVVFSQFTGFLNLIERVLKRDKFRYVRLDGSLTQRNRKKVLAEFNQPKRPCILVCSLKVAGVGLNLIKANRVYMMDTWWNEAIEDQAIDRIHRFGQQKPTYVVRFLINKSIEDRMLALQKKKRAIINDALGGAGDAKKSKARTLEDLQTIFAD